MTKKSDTIPEQLRLENQLCFPIYSASRLITRMYQPLLEELDLTYPQYLVLMVLWEYGSLGVKEMGKLLVLNSNTLSPLIKTLISKGFVEKTRSKEDERLVEICCTKTGAALQEKAASIPQKLVKSLQANSELEISIDELLSLRKTMWKLVDALNE